MEIEQIAPHLWWWTAPHPDWGPEDFTNGEGWARDVSSYALVEAGALVLFDPLVPAEDESTFWAALDSDVDEHGPPAILLTVFWHARSSREIFNRYEGTTVWAHEPSLDEFSKRAPVTNVFAAATSSRAASSRWRCTTWTRPPSGSQATARSSSETRYSATRTASDSAPTAGCATASRPKSYGRLRTAPSSGGRAGSY